MPNTMSVPKSAGDPCPQTSPNCPAAMGFVAVTTCLPNGTWDLMCKCVQASLCGTTASQCTPGAAVAQTCASMNMGTGMVSCDPTTCKLNFSMCHAAGGVSGTGG
jgi:hypothetical protein